MIVSGPPILLYQIGTDETRIVIDIPNTVYEAVSKDDGVKSYIRQHVIPILPRHRRPMAETALRDGRLRNMPNTWLPPSTNTMPGMFMLRDAMNMRHPLTGGGMTVALQDVVLLGAMLSPTAVPRLDDTRAVLAQMRKFYWKRKEFGSSLNILAQALHILFVADGCHPSTALQPVLTKSNYHASLTIRPATRATRLRPLYPAGRQTRR
jgi:squalene monooxygenase